MAYTDLDVTTHAPSNGAPTGNEVEADDVAERKEVLTLASKEIASGLGADILLDMLADKGVSMRQVARDSGFDVSVLSNIARGKHVSGPELWTLVALADAMGYDLDLTFHKR